MTLHATGSFARQQAKLVYQSNRKQTAAIWRASAVQELRVVSALIDREPNVACFHAHMAGEKAVKAALIATRNGVARTLVVTSLLDGLASAGYPVDEPVAAAARVLDRFYFLTRYPDAVGDIDPARLFSSADAGDALALARTVFAFADRIVDDAFGQPPKARA